jgi:TolB-like protein/Flp pilus assembly protein TadD
MTRRTREAEPSVGLWAELKRRNVIRMALLYCVGSWLVLQVADVLFGIIGVPDWSLRLVFGILLLGLPVALVFAWVFELTPEGLKRERPLADTEAAQRAMPEVPRRLDGAIVALLALALVAFVLDRWVIGAPEPAPTPAASAPGETTPGAVPVAPAAPEPPGRDATDAPAAASPDARSLAVLPFVNMSGDADNEYFSDGLTEELLNVLAQVDGLRVAARTSSFRFKNEVGDMADIARQLRVAHLLEGSVRRSGDRVRITAQLINAADGFHLWSETYDRQLTDIFAIQDDIAAEVAQALRVRLLGEAMPTVARPPTGDLAAYTAYLRGRQALRGSGYAAFERADAAFREALALDPDFAAAHAALAETWRQRAHWGIVPWSEARKHVREGVERALALDPDQPLAWMLDGSLQWEDLDPEASWIDTMDAAERSYRRALELEPGQPQASASLANLLRMRGRDDEALGLVLDALARDPLSAQAHLAVGNHYQSSGQLEQAGTRYLAAVELAPEDPRPAQVLSQLRYEQARIGEAIVLRAAALPLDPRDHEGPLTLVRYYLELGLIEAALPWLEAAERMAQEATTSQLVRAMWHWRHGERARAADLSAAALAAELPERWGSQIRFPIMVAMHELASGGYQRSLELILAEVPTALDPPAPDEPVTSFAFFQKLRSLVILRLRDGEAAARARALELQALVERQADSIPPEPLSFARLYLHGALGEADEFVAVWRSIDRGRYALDNWFWTESDLNFLTDREAPSVRALLAEQEAVRERERAWLAVPGRMPDPEAVLAEMARAAERAPERAVPPMIEPDPEPAHGPR